jgi:hypothetical protein
MRGIFAVDPGGSTGVAWGIFNARASSLDEALRNVVYPGSVTVTGRIRQQVREVASLWRAFLAACVNDGLLPPENVEYISEDFVPGNNAKKETISPLIISWCIEGYRMGRADQWLEAGRGRQVYAPATIWQMPGDGAGISNNILREAGFWVRGKDHEQSARRHVAFRVSSILKHNL